MKRKITKKDFIPWEEVKARILNTPKKRAEYETEYAKFKREYKAQLLKEIGQEVKKERRRQGISQEKLAERLKTSQSTINRVESGDQNLTIGYLDRISDSLGLDYEVRVYSRAAKEKEIGSL